jgi:hypothetical protein
MAQIIMLNNDTIVNPIKFENLFELQNKIEMKNEDGTIRTIYPKEAKGFHIATSAGDTIFFESNCGFMFTLFGDADNTCYFILKQKSGIVSLYYFVRKEIVVEGITTGANFTPSYMVKYKENWVSLKKNNFLQQFTKIIKPFKTDKKAPFFKKIKEFEHDLDKGEYLFDDIPKAIDRLNTIVSQ